MANTNTNQKQQSSPIANTKHISVAAAQSSRHCKASRNEHESAELARISGNTSFSLWSQARQEHPFTGCGVLLILFPNITCPVKCLVQQNVLSHKTASSWWEAWQCAGRHDAGRAENSTSWSQGNQEETTSSLHWAGLKHRTSKPTSPVTHFLQQSHTYSNKATPPDNVTSHGPHIFKPPRHFSYSFPLFETGTYVA